MLLSAHVERVSVSRMQDFVIGGCFLFCWYAIPDIGAVTYEVDGVVLTVDHIDHTVRAAW